MTRRTRGRPVAVLLMVLLGACSRPTATDDPARTTPSSSPHSCPVHGAGPPGTDSLALWVDSGGAYGPPREGTKAWELAAYLDGTVLRSVGPGFNEAPLSAMTVDHVDPCLVDATARQLTALATADVDLPLGTDMSTTTISLRDGSSAPVLEVKIYGLGRELTHPDDALPPNRDRARLAQAAETRRAVVALLADLADDPQPWHPDRLRVVEHAGEPYGYQPPTLTWPLGSLDEVLTRRSSVPACGELGGDEVRTLIDSLGNAPAQSRWADPYRTTLVAVAPLMPGQVGCPE